MMTNLALTTSPLRSPLAGRSELDVQSTEDSDGSSRGESDRDTLGLGALDTLTAQATSTTGPDRCAGRFPSPVRESLGIAMSRKPKSAPRVVTDDDAPLSSNPFAALRGALGGALGELLDAGGTEAAASEPEPTPKPKPKPEPTPKSASAKVAPKPKPKLRSKAPESGAPGLRGKIVVRREKKGRGGKTATIVEGLEASPETLADMAQRLRRSLGCGAKAEEHILVITGAQTERVRQWLLAEGATRVIVGN